MSTARERVRAEAEERFPLSFIEKTSVDFNGNRFPSAAEYNQVGFIAGRTVSAEQIEQAARHVRDGGDPDSALPRSVQWDRISEETREDYRQEMRALFAAAGLIVEEE